MAAPLKPSTTPAGREYTPEPATTSGTNREATGTHFSRLVGHWSQFGPPLRPSPSDTAVVDATIRQLPAPPRAIVLGLTPETIGCRWPHETALLALDHDPVMVARLWPNPDAPPHAQVALAQWQHMPVPDASADIVCSDGCHTPLTFPDGFGVLAREVSRVLRPGGFFVARVFVRPDEPPTCAAIATDLAMGRIGSVHALKLRLLAALHGVGGNGTGLDAVWRAWKQLPAPPSALAGQRGWTALELQSLESYAGLSTRYHLPRLAPLQSLHSAFFDAVGCHFANYDQAEQCPTLVWRKR